MIEKYGQEEQIEFDEPNKIILEQLGSFARTKTEQFNETNIDLERFTQKINEKFKPEDQRQIYDALILMFTVHIDQKDRPDGEPYVRHPLAVADKVMDITSEPDKDLVIAALMHDSVEDQSDQLAELSDNEEQGLTQEQISLMEIKNKYGERVSNIVSGLSNPDFTEILKESKVAKNDPRFQELKNELYAQHVQESIENQDILTIKLIDFSDNALSLEKLPIETNSQIMKKQKLISKYVPVMKIFIDRLQRDNLFPKYQQLLLEKYNQYMQIN